MCDHSVFHKMTYSGKYLEINYLVSKISSCHEAVTWNPADSVSKFLIIRNNFFSLFALLLMIPTIIMSEGTPLCQYSDHSPKVFQMNVQVLLHRYDSSHKVRQSAYIKSGSNPAFEHRMFLQTMLRYLWLEESFFRLNELTHVKRLKQFLPCSKCSIEVSFGCFIYFYYHIQVHLWPPCWGQRFSPPLIIIEKLEYVDKQKEDDLKTLNPTEIFMMVVHQYFIQQEVFVNVIISTQHTLSTIRYRLGTEIKKKGVTHSLTSRTL